ncbi:hypothetical protein EI94DRAFT_1806013 [Lactarius quietus]|nr:hypothetical protein EI94DRAFT_1806013 [Lactarius quietus]
MSSCHKHTIIPTEKAQDMPLMSESHCRAIAAASAAPQPQAMPLVPASSIPGPLESSQSTLATVNTHDPLPAPSTPPSTKWPHTHALLPAASIQTIPDDDTDSGVVDDTPHAKKVKMTPHQALQGDASVIIIEDGDNQKDKPLNKINPSVDVKAFFTEVPRLPGQNKGHMQCNLQGLVCPKQEKFLTSEHTTLCQHAAALHAHRYRKWCKLNHFNSMLPEDANPHKSAALNKGWQSSVIDHFDMDTMPIHYSYEAFKNTSIAWLIKTNQEGTPFDKHAQNDQNFKDNGSPRHIQYNGITADPPMLEANLSAAMAYSESDPGSNLSQKQGPGPNLNSNTSGKVGQVGPPPNEDDLDNPVVDVKGGLNSQQQVPGPNLNSNTSEEDQFVPSQNDGNDLHSPNADAEGGLDSD